MTELSRPPRLGLLYAKAVASSLTAGGALPDDVLVLRDVEIDRAHVARYSRVCGFPLRNAVPASYPHIIAFPLAVALMARPSFPLPLPGLVHVANRVTQARPIDAAERLTLRVRAADLRPHPKGRQFDIVAEARVGDEQVWSSASTYLRRGEGGETPPVPAGRERPPATARWPVPADIGRRYAAVSGDHNPIHLRRLAARLFGFPRPIAHGMWTKARCLAALDPRLPAAFTVTVDFRKPVLLPARVAFGFATHGDGLQFDLWDDATGAPHLRGAVTEEQGA